MRTMRIKNNIFCLGKSKLQKPTSLKPIAQDFLEKGGCAVSDGPRAQFGSSDGKLKKELKSLVHTPLSFSFTKPFTQPLKS